MAKINEFRTFCPVCNVQMKAEKSVEHIRKFHLEVDNEDIEAIYEFIQVVDIYRMAEDLRLELDLKNLTFIQLLNPTIIDNSYHVRNINSDSATHEKEKNSHFKKSAFIKCEICDRLVLKEQIEEHNNTIHRPENKVIPKRNWLPRYSKVTKPIYGYKLQGGAPGLGKRA